MVNGVDSSLLETEVDGQRAQLDHALGSAVVSPTARRQEKRERRHDFIEVIEGELVGEVARPRH